MKMKTKKNGIKKQIFDITNKTKNQKMKEDNQITKKQKKRGKHKKQKQYLLKKQKLKWMRRGGNIKNKKT